ncbi:MAG TPA: YihY/virulence factor BrkB family protein [Beutenbergiaceae bacterium]|nr:YihY/virulence factor BrkB family protein [Beutenbergiaceae bacterium]
MLFVAVVLSGFAVAAATRRWSPLRRWISPAATTLLALIGAFPVGLSLMEVTSGAWRPILTLGGALVSAAALVHLGAAVNHYVLDPVRTRRAERSQDQDLLARVEERLEDRDKPDRRISLISLTFRAIRRIQEVRVTGLAAEMTYYGLISLVPLALALGSSLGYLERILGAAQVERIETTLVDAVATIFASDVTDDVLVPLIEGLLDQERTGVAIGSVLVALWLASRMFRAAIRALDDAYAVPERRSFLGLQVLGLALAGGAVLTLIVLVSMVVIGPLLGGGQQIAEQFGLGGFFEVAWAVLRWPAVAAVTTAYLTILYRFGPNIDTTWTRCLPGAVLGTVLLIGISLGFGQYLAYTGTSVLEGETVQDTAVQAAAQTVGLVLAGVLWMWLSSIALLSGGVLNAELDQGARATGTVAKSDDGAASQTTGATRREASVRGREASVGEAARARE